MSANGRRRFLAAAAAVGAAAFLANAPAGGAAGPYWPELSPFLGTPSLEEGVLQKVNVNTARVDELAAVPGIGEERARAIVAYRDQNGLFLSVDDLLSVRGIGPNELAAFRDAVTVQ
jgi:competence protein ComEA